MVCHSESLLFLSVLLSHTLHLCYVLKKLTDSIHKFSTQDDYVNVSKRLRKTLGKLLFYGQKEPTVFMADDSTYE